MYSSLASVCATRKRLAELGLDTKKYLGQHFLVDDGVVGKIVRLASLEPEIPVVEVGPGIGTLTEALLKTGVVLTSVEIDARLLDGLRAHYPSLQLIGANALSSQVVSKLRVLKPVSLVANLPYGVAATLILEYFQQVPSLKSATVMVQREVADRITAKPGSKDYGAYTIKLRLLAKALGHFSVAPQCFYPPPRVDSTVVRLERTSFFKEPLVLASTLAEASFFQRRKTVRNSMRAYFSEHNLDLTTVDTLLAKSGIDSRVRGETLLPHDYLRMAQAALLK